VERKKGGKKEKREKRNRLEWPFFLVERGKKEVWESLLSPGNTSTK